MQAAHVANPYDVLTVGGRGEAQARILAVSRTAVVIAIHKMDDGETVARELRARRKDLHLVKRRVDGVRFGRSVEQSEPLAAERGKAEIVVRPARHGVHFDEL